MHINHNQYFSCMRSMALFYDYYICNSKPKSGKFYNEMEHTRREITRKIRIQFYRFTQERLIGCTIYLIKNSLDIKKIQSNVVQN